MKSNYIRALGIDLGTTNSAAAEIVWDPGPAFRPEPGSPAVRVLEIEQPTREGLYTSPLVPSVVAILPDGRVWVGEGAKRLRAFPTEYGLSFEKNLFYDTKNEMGLRKTWFRAPESFNHASKIGGKVLEFIAGEAAKASANLAEQPFQLAGGDPERTGAEGLAQTAECGTHEPIAVTVPASFQLNQRRDTLLAARYAGLRLADDDLLDEPTAALIDYFVSNSQPFPLPAGRPALCVVFDFGGGTCDVSVIEISREGPSLAPSPLLPPSLSGLTLSQLAVSRYHRLGGGDIDAAIVHEILIPRLLAENNLDPLALTFAQKKKGLEPQLLGKAEALKIALSLEILRLIKFGRYPSSPSDKSSIVVRQPPLTCTLGGASYTLSDPSLSAEQFERVHAPFLDTDFLFARETEYRLTLSIFAPLRDAMDRASRDASDVDLCLLAGGSTLIPQVRDALRAFFPKTRLVFHDDGLEAKLCVSRGAAWNAAYKALASRPLIQPGLHDGIVLITADGKPNPLIPSRTGLPFPADGSFLKERLVVPPSASLPVRELRFEVVGELDGQHIFDEIWSLPEGVEPGDEIVLEYRVTGGKQFECCAHLAARPSALLEVTVENPLVNIANPNATQLKIEGVEEELRSRQGGTARDRDTYVNLARMYAELNQREKALDYLRTAQSRLPRPDFEILNLQGIYFGELGDHDRATTAFLESDRAEPRWGVPLFNLALSFRRRGMHAEALETLEGAIRKVEDPGPYLGLKTLSLESLGRTEESRAVAAQAVRAFAPPAAIDDWDLGWLLTAAQIAGNDAVRKRAEEEQKKRHRLAKSTPARDDILRPAAWGDGPKPTPKPDPEKPPSKSRRKPGGKRGR